MKGVSHITESVVNLENKNNRDTNEIDLLMSELNKMMITDREIGKIIGPLIARLSKLRKTTIVKNRKRVEKSKSYSDTDKRSNWIKVGNGFLKIGNKTGGKNRSFQMIFDENTNTVLTILSEREGAVSMGESCRLFGIDWIWLPLSNGKIPSKNLNSEINSVFKRIREKLENKERIYIHCAAGMHRTGMITNALLLFLGHDEKTSYEILYKLRPITAMEVRDDRLNWGKEFVFGNLGLRSTQLL